MNTTRRSLLFAGLGVGAVTLVGCGSSSDSSSNASSSGPVTLTFRTWDENAAAAYKTSFAAFTKANPTITVKTEIVPWANYFTKLHTDIAGRTAPDLFWLNNSNLGPYATNNALINITDKLGSDAVSAWVPSVVKQFTINNSLWGVPQTSDGGIAVYYNKKLVADAGLKESDISKLTWSPDGGSNTLLTVTQKLTKDKAGHTADQSGFDPKQPAQWGYSAAYDLQANCLPFIGSNGGTYQDGDKFTLTNPKTVQAFQYLVDLINKYHVAPSAANTNTDGNFTLNQFNQGKIALFQTGLYNLANVQSAAKFEWGVVGLPAGPAGAISVTNGIAVVGNANSANADATLKLLQFLGTKEGNAAIGASGANLPGVVAAQDGYKQYWESKKVDLAPFFDVLKNGTIPAPTGVNFAAGYTAADPILQQIFLGRLSVPDGLAQANKAANAAIAS